MTVKEIYDKLETFNDEERAKYAGALCNSLSPASMQTLMSFQDNWDGTKTAQEFFVAQSQEIKKCVELEVSKTGEIVRQAMQLEPLMWETNIID